MELAFKSVDDLYKRVKPALRSKLKEFNQKNIDFIKEEDVWNFLIENKWKQMRGLELNEIVDDILNIDNDKIIFYVQSKMGKFTRKANFKDANIL